MSIDERKKIADEADMIVDGYSFTYKDKNIVVVNLNTVDPHVMLINESGKMLESSMDPIEQSIALDIWDDNKEFMEV